MTVMALISVCILILFVGRRALNFVLGCFFGFEDDNNVVCLRLSVTGLLYSENYVVFCKYGTIYVCYSLNIVFGVGGYFLNFVLYSRLCGVLSGYCMKYVGELCDEGRLGGLTGLCKKIGGGCFGQELRDEGLFDEVAYIG